MGKVDPAAIKAGRAANNNNSSNESLNSVNGQRTAFVYISSHPLYPGDKKDIENEGGICQRLLKKPKKCWLGVGCAIFLAIALAVVVPAVFSRIHHLVEAPSIPTNTIAHSFMLDITTSDAEETRTTVVTCLVSLIVVSK